MQFNFSSKVDALSHLTDNSSIVSLSTRSFSKAFVYILKSCVFIVKLFLFNFMNSEEARMTYTMMQTCKETDMTYQALKYYCNEGLVPNVKRDDNNRRIFDERDVKWIKDLVCLKKCGMSIKEIAARLDISQRTVHLRQASILAKLKLESTADLLLWMLRDVAGR